jgi:hypothetical protein
MSLGGEGDSSCIVALSSWFCLAVSSQVKLPPFTRMRLTGFRTACSGWYTVLSRSRPSAVGPQSTSEVVSAHSAVTSYFTEVTKQCASTTVLTAGLQISWRWGPYVRSISRPGPR